MNKDYNHKHCKLGIFYYNPDNLSESIEKRRGIGTTINFDSKIGNRIITLLLTPAIIILLLILFEFFK